MDNSSLQPYIRHLNEKFVLYNTQNPFYLPTPLEIEIHKLQKKGYKVFPLLVNQSQWALYVSAKQYKKPVLHPVRMADYEEMNKKRQK